MASQAKVGVPSWYWVAAVVGLLFEIFGCTMYIQQVTMSPETFAQMPQTQQDMLNAAPGWVTASFALGVWSGLAGTIGLLLRRAWALPFMLLSVLSVIVDFGWFFTAGQMVQRMGPASAIPPIFIFLMSLFLTWLASTAKKRGWLS